MTRRILKKSVKCFLKQPLVENILPRSQPRKENRKKRFLAKSYQNKMNESYLQPAASKINKLDKMKETEQQIVSDFWKKRDLREEPYEQSNNKALQTWDLSAQTRTMPEQSRSSTISQAKLIQSKDRPLATQSVLFAASRANVFLLLSIEQIRNALLSKRIERQNRSELKSKILESRKIRFLYGGLSDQQLRKSIQRSQQLSGNASDNLLALLESRLDVVLERCSFFPSIKAARQSVLHKRVFVNSRMVNRPGCQLRSGDIIQVKLYGESFKEIPSTLAAHAHDGRDLQSFVCKTTSQLDQGAFKKAGFFPCPWGFVAPPFILSSLSQLESFLFTLGWGRMPLVYKSKADALLLNLFKDGQLLSISTSERNNQLESFSREQIDNLTLHLAKITQNSELSHVLRDQRKALKPSKREVTSSMQEGREVVRTDEMQRQVTSYFSTFGIGEKSCLQNKVNAHKPGAAKRAEPSTWEDSTPSSSYRLVCKQEDIFKSKSIVNSCYHSKERFHLAQEKAQLLLLRSHIITRAPESVNNSALRPQLEILASNQGSTPTKRSNFSSSLHLCSLEKGKARNLKKKVENIGDLDPDANRRKEFLVFSLNESFYNTYFYWLEVKRRLRFKESPEPSNEKNKRERWVQGKEYRGEIEREEEIQSSSSSNSLALRAQHPFLNDFRSFQERKSKPLHLELSYKSGTAVFLYAPQRVYLPALIDLDLLVRTL